MTTSPEPVPPFAKLSARANRTWKNIESARALADVKRRELAAALASIGIPENTAVAVFGSLARREVTSKSDADWTFLIDGPCDPEHVRIAQRIADSVKSCDFPPPGRTGMFGQMTNGYELIHHIGGDEDTNKNLTRRVLLLLESLCLTDPITYERVIRGILSRYIACDGSVSVVESQSIRVPRFLLNDVVRLWRTFAVDYAAKKWERSAQGWALRNAKLRMARKLTFVKGLLLCFDCELDPPSSSLPPEKLSASHLANQLVARCLSISKMTPIDALSQLFLTRGTLDTAVTVLTAYDDYLALINDESKREHLDGDIPFEDSPKDPVFQEVRQISRRFRDGIESTFFDDELLKKLIRKYGVF